MLRFALFLREKGEKLIFFLNDHVPSENILNEYGFAYETVIFGNDMNWEQRLIQAHDIYVWVNDRLNTTIEHAQHIKAEQVPLITMDDRGEGAALSDLNVAGLIFDELDSLKGTKILTGSKYLILDSEINRLRRLRRELKRIVVSMGGSDTYGVSIDVVNMLKATSLAVTVIVGPGFEHMEKLKQVMPENFTLRVNVPSLIETFAEFDLAFTAGGVTPFEACASGLPCVIIATESFEIPVGEYIEKTGCGIFAGHYDRMKHVALDENIGIEKMSQQCMVRIDTKGAERVYGEILKI